VSTLTLIRHVLFVFSPAGIQYIISSTIPELESNPNRTFTYVEMAYFARWFYEQNDSMQERVRKLVASGQLGFANGGW